MIRISQEQLINRWSNIQASLWFVPSLFATGAVGLALAIPAINDWLLDQFEFAERIAFSGTSDAARTVLSVIAGSTITVISLLFSIMIVALRQASTQFSPRILRNFMQDRGNQIVLAVYLATFLYGILILGQIRGGGDNQEAEVPGMAVSTAIAFAVVCLGLLVYFIHHAASLFQASNIVEHIRLDLRGHVEAFYPAGIGVPIDDRDDGLEAFRERVSTHSVQRVFSNGSGFLRSVDDSMLVAAFGEGRWAIVRPWVGTYVSEGDLLAEVDGGEDIADAVRRSFVLDRERTMHQDLFFGIRQLVDVALKALSPSINDPTTAEHALSGIGTTMGVLVNRPFPSRARVVELDGGGEVHLWMNRPGWDDVVDVAFSQIRRAGRDQVHLTLHLLKVIAQIGDHAPAARVRPLLKQIDDVAWYLSEGEFSPNEVATVGAAIEAARERVLQRAFAAYE